VKADVELIKDYRGSGVDAIRILLAPEGVIEELVTRAITTGTPPEGNIVGWVNGYRVVIEGAILPQVALNEHLGVNKPPSAVQMEEQKDAGTNNADADAA